MSEPLRAPCATPEWLDDAALARAVAAGDRVAFERLMRRNNRRLFRLARAALRDDAEAEDALQDAYLAAFRAIGGFRGEASLATWLSRLVLNACNARLRRTARRNNVVPMVPIDDAEALPMDDRDTRPDHLAARAQLRALVEHTLDRLPEGFRTVFVLRAVEELTVEETAEVLGIPEATVRSRHFRARGLLREALAREIDVAERDLYDFGGVHCDRVVGRVLGALDAPVPNTRAR
jgi:RNA polymerase sigma-70 factor (ECF subfamily)